MLMSYVDESRTKLPFGDKTWVRKSTRNFFVLIFRLPEAVVTSAFWQFS